jgi:hypothetical protein
MWACWVTHNLHCPGWRGELNGLRSARKNAKICVDNAHSWFRWFWCQIAQLSATFTNKLLRMVNAFRGTDGKLAYLSSIGWFVPSNFRKQEVFEHANAVCSHRLNVLCIQSVGQYTIGNWFHPLRWRIICLFHRLVLHFFLGCYTFKLKLPP